MHGCMDGLMDGWIGTLIKWKHTYRYDGMSAGGMHAYMHRLIDNLLPDGWMYT